MHFESKLETRTKFTIRDFHKVPTPKKIFRGKLRLRVTLRLRVQNMKLCTCVSKPGVLSANINEQTFRIYIIIIYLEAKTKRTTWSILRHATAYSSSGKQCSLCTQEKLCILKAN
jgi:hypothetical protein